MYRTIMSGGEIPTRGLASTINMDCDSRSGSRSDCRTEYTEEKINIHYKTVVRSEVKEELSEEVLDKVLEEKMLNVYREMERKKKEKVEEDTEPSWALTDKMASILFLFPFFQSCFFMVKLAKSDFWHLHCNPCPIPEGAYLGSGEWVAAAWSWSLGCSHKAQRACWVNPRDCYDLERIRSSPSCQTAFLSISFICSSISA